MDAAALAPALLRRPRPESRRCDAKLRGRPVDVGIVPDPVEPLQHERDVLAEGADLVDRYLLELDASAGDVAQDLRHFGPRQLVTRDVDRATIELRGPLERLESVRADVAHGD